MTQDDLALKAGYTSRSSIAKIEANANGVVQSKLIKLAKALQTTPGYLLGWDEREKKNDTIADIVLALRTDEELVDMIKIITELTPDQRNVVKTMLFAFKKDKID